MLVFVDIFVVVDVAVVVVTFMATHRRVMDKCVMVVRPRRHRHLFAAAAALVFGPSDFVLLMVAVLIVLLSVRVMAARLFVIVIDGCVVAVLATFRQVENGTSARSCRIQIEPNQPC